MPKAMEEEMEDLVGPEEGDHKDSLTDPAHESTFNPCGLKPSTKAAISGCFSVTMAICQLVLLCWSMSVVGRARDAVETTLPANVTIYTLSHPEYWGPLHVLASTSCSITALNESALDASCNGQKVDVAFAQIGAMQKWLSGNWMSVGGTSMDSLKSSRKIAFWVLCIIIGVTATLQLFMLCLRVFVWYEHEKEDADDTPVRELSKKQQAENAITQFLFLSAPKQLDKLIITVFQLTLLSLYTVFQCGPFFVMNYIPGMVLTLCPIAFLLIFIGVYFMLKDKDDEHVWDEVLCMTCSCAGLIIVFIPFFASTIYQLNFLWKNHHGEGVFDKSGYGMTGWPDQNEMMKDQAVMVSKIVFGYNVLSSISLFGVDLWSVL